MKRRAKKSATRAFTLIELMMVMGMMAILAAAIGMALAQAMEQGRVQRTQAQVARIHSLLMTRYDSYRTKSIRLTLPPTWTAQQRALARLNILREIMRLEMPQCVGDIVGISGNTPVLTTQANRFFMPVYMPPNTPYPALSNNYFRRVQSSPAFVNAGAIEAECLYLILGTIEDGDGSALSFLLPSEVGDTDGDGMLEVLDSWGKPIVFLRWAPGYVNNPLATYSVASSFQNGVDPDPFDPMKVDTRGTYSLVPLICSSGPDGSLGLVTANLDEESSDPFQFLPPDTRALGTPAPVAGEEFWRDNITNHFMAQN